VKVLTFWVSGIPVPKERARTVRLKSGRMHTFTPGRTAAWEQRVGLVAQSACSAAGWKPAKGSYGVEVDVYRARRAGDADNYLKAVKDALNAIVWPDDRMVKTATARLVDPCRERFRRCSDGKAATCVLAEGHDCAHSWAPPMELGVRVVVTVG
jgi:Holliday junction resolvase RusA-like endonuclease